MNFTDKWYHVFFSAGVYSRWVINEEGKMVMEEYEITEQHVKIIADSYDPDLYEASFTLGHVGTGAPAFGWVGKLKAEGHKLFAQFSHVDESLANAYANKNYKRCSIELDEVDGKDPYLVGIAATNKPRVHSLPAMTFSREKSAVYDMPLSDDFKFSAQPKPKPMNEKLKLLASLFSLEVDEQSNEDAVLDKIMTAAKDKFAADAGMIKKDEFEKLQSAASKFATEELIRQGKISPLQKDYFESSFKSDFEGTLTTAKSLPVLPERQADVVPGGTGAITDPGIDKFTLPDGKKIENYDQYADALIDNPELADKFEQSDLEKLPGYKKYNY